jgi:hypothetical protein
MKRRLFKLCVLLLLGAIVDVAVAWGCAAFADFDPARDVSSFQEGGSGTWESREVCVGFGRQRIERLAGPFRGRDPVTDGGVEDRAGWPLLTLKSLNYHGFRLGDPNPFVEGLPSGIIDGIELSPHGQYWDWKALPLRPIALGFAINTIFYAAILWLLFAAPFTLRRHLRVRRNLCPHCAYPVGTNDVCTECGRAVKAKHVEAIA